jgi:hypothetical protein
MHPTATATAATPTVVERTYGERQQLERTDRKRWRVGSGHQRFVPKPPSDRAMKSYERYSDGEEYDTADDAQHEWQLIAWPSRTCSAKISPTHARRAA